MINNAFFDEQLLRGRNKIYFQHEYNMQIQCVARTDIVFLEFLPETDMDILQLKRVQISPNLLMLVQLVICFVWLPVQFQYAKFEITIISNFAYWNWQSVLME